jgi:D-threo-aldose 1-dehydrogenase
MPGLIELPQSGVRTTALGFGMSSLNGGVLERRTSLRLLDAAYDAGIRHFDTAPLYGLGQAESVLGEFLRRRGGGDVSIATKYGLARPSSRGLLEIPRSLARQAVRFVPALKPLLLDAYGRWLRRAPVLAGSAPVSVAASRFDAAGLRSSLEDSLRMLHVEHVHLFLLHEAGPADLTEEVHDALEEARHGGKIGTWGLGGARVRVQAAIDAGLHLPVAQFDWNPLDARLPAVPGSLLILNRWMGHALAAIARQSAERRAELARAWGVDVADRHALVRFLAGSVRRANPAGIALFSSKRESHIRDVATAFAQGAAPPPI